MSLPACSAALPAWPMARSTSRPAFSAGPPEPAGVSRLHALSMVNATATSMATGIDLIVRLDRSGGAGGGLAEMEIEKLARRGQRRGLGRGLLDLRREHGGKLPRAQAGLETQHEAPAVVDHDFVVVVRGVLPALDHRKNGEAPAAEVEGARSLFSSHSPVAMHANFHDDTSLEVCSSSKQVSRLPQ